MFFACLTHTQISSRFSPDPKSAHFLPFSSQLVCERRKKSIFMHTHFKSFKNRCMHTYEPYLHSHITVVSLFFRESIICFLPFSDYPFTELPSCSFYIYFFLLVSKTNGEEEKAKRSSSHLITRIHIKHNRRMEGKNLLKWVLIP